MLEDFKAKNTGKTFNESAFGRFPRAREERENLGSCGASSEPMRLRTRNCIVCTRRRANSSLRAISTGKNAKKPGGPERRLQAGGKKGWFQGRTVNDNFSYCPLRSNAVASVIKKTNH